MSHPFRFMLAQGEPLAGPKFRELARAAEASGYACLVIPDHLLDQLAALPALAYAAAATERLRLGTYVLNNDLRHPSVLAHDLATIDLLSEGRLEIGIGAGWNQPEYEQIQLPFDSGGVRVRRLAESLRVLKMLFAGEPFDFDGEFYKLRRAEGRPLPAQRPHPPLLVGGGGRRLLSLAAREANIIGLAGRHAGGAFDPLSCLAPATDEKVGWIREAAGKRFPELELGTYASLAEVRITDRPLAEAGELAAQLNTKFGTHVTAEELLDSPHVFFGSAEELAQKCLAMRERWGISNVMVTPPLESFAPVVERLAGT